MKKFGKRFAALALALALAVGAGQTAFASWALGTELVDRTVTLAPGTALTSQSLWSASKSDLRTEHYITYTPGGQVKPVIFSGNYVASTNTVATAAAQLKAQGYRVVAAVNGGWFNTDGTIVGALVTDGVVRSLDVQNYTLLGITNDGQVFIDESTLTKKVSWNQVDGSDFNAVLAGYNAFRHANYVNGLFLYNQDFATKVSSSTDNVSAILRPLDGGVMRMNGSMTFEVVSVADTAQEDVSFNGVLPEGCYMLYVEYHENNAWLTDGVRALAPGQQVTVALGGVSEQWNNAAYGISSLYPLLRDGEIVSTNLSTAANPYTAVGIKADGSAVFYTIDGRQSGYSVGATYAQVAQRLQELGCVTAVALDGGGSTNLGATLPGSDSFSILNRPSEAGRRVNNTILLVTPDTGATGVAAGTYVSAEYQVVLAGADLPVSAQLYDTAGFPMDGYAFVWNATGGMVTGDGDSAVYTAGMVPGTYAISAAAGEDVMPIRVIDILSQLKITREGSAAQVSSLRLKPGDVVELNAAGTWWNLPVAMGDGNVAWMADPSIGTIDGSGCFTAGQDNASGAITATAGGKTVTISVSVERNDPFTDIAGHWSADFVTRLYELGLTSGYEQADGTYIFRPNGQLTRGELLTFIARLLKVDTSEYENVVLPFADADTIADWLQPYVKSMYALGVFEGSASGGRLYANVGSNVTREAAITMLGRVLAASGSCDLSGFDDADSVSAWASAYVQTLVALNIVEGSGGKLTPKSDITRGAAAKLLVEVYGLDKAQLVPRTDLVRE